ncbi:MAG: hypothetical protein PHO92_02725 [Candidatus Peribacteraceae bacterium]|nr:hypothetical protein [Candidatus Peribacteraceae bacterium]
MATTPNKGSSQAEPALLFESLKGKLPPAVIIERCEKAVMGGIKEFEQLLAQLLHHRTESNAAPEMRYILAARARLRSLAQGLEIQQQTLAQKLQECKKPYQIAANAELRAHPELKGNEPVRKLVEDFSRRYLQCAALAELCEHAVRKTLENDVMAILNEGNGGEGESPRQRAVRESMKHANNAQPKTASATPESPRIGDSGELAPQPQATLKIQPEGVIDFQEVPSEETLSGT